MVSTLAGVAEHANLTGSHRLTVDADGNVITISGEHNVVSKITPDGVVSSLAGHDSEDDVFLDLVCVAVDGRGNVIVADRGNHRIHQISRDGMVTTLAGSSERGS
eukprot:CAMPEP_0203883536 /NCGR_PEP_ID=MMETSP0359-20131031/27642_1 /ASSEMBLY_ACC=CAM_ASM_000338 /TAXON_ID=268821 /ORGANISM="Scrippsiella Hangoei, Strain SHTV-5" /LENGTH=104 /DNA_ID=CAMNT_0050803795 /DNA_START=1 /DNA_END=312 /DNA_ORIENTATION=+